MKFKNLILPAITAVVLGIGKSEASAQKAPANPDSKEKIGSAIKMSFAQKYEKYVTKNEHMPKIELPVDIALVSVGAVSSREDHERKMIHAGSAISPNINVKGFSVERKIFVQCDFVNSNNKREEITFILNQGGDGAWRLEKKELQSGLTGNFYVAFADNGKN